MPVATTLLPLHGSWTPFAGAPIANIGFDLVATGAADVADCLKVIGDGKTGVSTHTWPHIASPTPPIKALDTRGGVKFNDIDPTGVMTGSVPLNPHISQIQIVCKCSIICDHNQIAPQTAIISQYDSTSGSGGAIDSGSVVWDSGSALSADGTLVTLTATYLLNEITGLPWTRADLFSRSWGFLFAVGDDGHAPFTGNYTATITVDYFACIVSYANLVATPATGSSLGSDTIALYSPDGAIQPGATVKFDGTPATGVVVIDTNNATCVSPAHAVAGISIILTNPDATTLTATFNYVPIITSVAPVRGVVAGGTPVTLTGSGFETGATITFGGVPATSVVFVSTTSMTCVTPAHALGAVDVVLTNPDATVATLTGGYTYGIVVTSVTAPHGATFGADRVTVSGDGFVTGATIQFGGVLATSVVFVDSHTLNCLTPAHVWGVVDVLVTDPDASNGTLVGGFTYVQPTITTIDPNLGATVGGDLITVRGEGFAPNATLSFGGVPATGVTYSDSTLLVCLTPANATLGAVDVQVRNPTDGGIGTLPKSYTYVGPRISSIYKANGSLGGGNHVQIFGFGFVAGCTVTFGGVAATAITVPKSTYILCTTPAHAIGQVDIVVTNPDTNTGTLAHGFTFVQQASTPIVKAGAGAIIRGLPPSIFQTKATVTPGNPAGTITYLWTQLDGPAGVATINAPTTLGTTITFQTYCPGTYRFQLTATAAVGDEPLLFSASSILVLVVSTTIPPKIRSTLTHV